MGKNEIKTFYKIIQVEIKQYIIKYSKNNSLVKELTKVIFNAFFDSKKPNYLNIKQSNKEIFLYNSLFDPYNEILYSYDTLKDIKYYCNNFPFQKENLRIRYLRYNIENYLNEMYILKNRLESFPKKLERLYKNCSKINNKKFKNFQLIFKDKFNKYDKIRGEHVHQYRYYDKDIKRLSLIENLTPDILEIIEINKNSNTIDGIEVKDIPYKYYLDEYNKIKNKWIKRINNDLKIIKILLNFYFKGLRIIITENNKLIYPFE